MPLLPGDRRQVLEQQRGDALALMLVVDHERRLSVVAAGPALVAGPRDQLVVALDDERGPVDEVDVGEALQLGLGQLRLGREVPAVDALGGLAAVELGQCAVHRRGGSGGCAPSRRRRGRRCWPTRTSDVGRRGHHAAMMPWTARPSGRGVVTCHDVPVASPPRRAVLQLDLDHPVGGAARTAAPASAAATRCVVDRWCLDARRSCSRISRTSDGPPTACGDDERRVERAGQPGAGDVRARRPPAGP